MLPEPLSVWAWWDLALSLWNMSTPLTDFPYLPDPIQGHGVCCTRTHAKAWTRQTHRRGQRLKIWFIYRKSYSFEFNIYMNGLTLCLLRYSTIITCFSLWDSQNTILFFIIDRNTWECLGTLHGMCLHVWFLRLRQNNNTSSVIQGNAEVWVKAVDFRIGDSAGKEGKRNSHVWKKKDFGNTLESTYFAPNGALRNWVKINI